MQKLVESACSILFLFFVLNASGQKNYHTNSGVIHFNSNAVLEVIEATSNRMAGTINPKEKIFAFAVDITSFTGFNGALQREHFNENYMESNKFRTASFTGKIIEDVDFSKDSVYHVRAKGMLNVHGVEQERIIKSIITINHNKAFLQTEFTILLKDHHIKIPKVVHEKIASEITVQVKAELKKE